MSQQSTSQVSEAEAQEAGVQESGVQDTEPDYRFTLANERTFLAWIRTALALLAAGVAADELIGGGAGNIDHSVLAVTCVVVATLLSLGAFHRWRRVQSAMRRSDPLPPASIVRITVGGVCAIALVCVVVVIL
ncbi:YidH family protein [Gordonia sp. DT218]|uniref:YidH family protein n=1 Tax=unclassified Gordonia (in: high G+C Gram-positive bacteria) TaxID=2657482 RepID=UPI003CE6CEFE